MFIVIHSTFRIFPLSVLFLLIFLSHLKPNIVSSETCDILPEFKLIAADLSNKLGQCVSPATEEGAIIRQKFVNGDLMLRSVDGALGFHDGSSFFLIEGQSLSEISIEQWLSSENDTDSSRDNVLRNLTATTEALQIPDTNISLGSNSNAHSEVSHSVLKIRNGDVHGTAISTQYGLITSAHIIGNSDNVEVISVDGDIALARVLRRDEVFDIAQLEVPWTINQLHISPTARLRINDDAFIIGNSTRDSSIAVYQVKIVGLGKEKSGLESVEIIGDLPDSASGGPLISASGDFWGMFSYARRKPDEHQKVIHSNTLSEFSNSSGSRIFTDLAGAMRSNSTTSMPTTPVFTPSLPSPTPRAPSIAQPTSVTRNSFIASPTPAATGAFRSPGDTTSPARLTSDLPGKIIRRDFFDSDRTTLFLGKLFGYTFSVLDREYRIFGDTSKEQYSLLVGLSYIDVPDVPNVIIKFTARLVGEVEDRTISTACRTTDNGDQYRLTVVPETRAYAVDKMINGKWLGRPVPWNVTDAIESHPRNKNRIEFSCTGSEFSVSINGKRVASFTDIEIVGGRSWVGGGLAKERVGTIDARFSEITVERSN